MQARALAVRHARWLVPALLAAAGTALGFRWIGARDLNFADEGYLWYGVKRVLAGDYPLRDFQSYDPGRYFWCAWFAPWFGSGILGVRAAAAVFQALGLWASLCAVRRLGRPVLLWQALALPLLWLWIFPRHKLFEPALELLLVLAFTRLFERPARAQRIACGALVALAGWFGRNHALYGSLAALLAFLLLAWKRRDRSLLPALLDFALGGVLGAAPFFYELACVPGFAGGLATSLRDLAHKGTNIPYPWPWPWSVDWAAAPRFELTNVLSFALAPLVLGLGALSVLRTRREDLGARALLASGVCLGLPYLHHVLVRSDFAHLAQCIHPVLLVALALPRGARARGLLAAGLLAFSALAALDHHPQLDAFDPWLAERPRYVAVSVAGETLQLSEIQAQVLERVERTVHEHVRPDEALFVAPSRPLFYPLLDKTSPTYQIYLFWYATPEEQEDIEQRLERARVPWILLVDTAVDDRDDLRFARTHPDVVAYIARRYEPVPAPLLPPGYALLRRRAE